MEPAVLRGREHTILGAVAAIGEGRSAIALSRGGAKKIYEYTDPNEDTAAFVEGEGGILLAVADGHGGYEAAETAVERLLDRNVASWTGRDASIIRASWSRAARAALLDINDAILSGVALGGAYASRTTLALALIRPREDLFAFASVGDSHVFRVDGSGAVDLGPGGDGRTAYLGDPWETGETLSKKCVAGSEGLAGIRAVMLLTDGISEPGIGVDEPELAVLEAIERARRVEAELRPLEAARGAVELALSAHRRNRSGDNVASAVAWLD